MTVGAFDLGGVLYHAKYLELLEQTREAFLTLEGLPYRTLMDDGYHIVVAETAQRFLAPIRYGERIVVEMWTQEVLRSTFTLVYDVFTWPAPVGPERELATELDEHPRKTRVHTATTRLACVRCNDPRNQIYSAARIPQPLQAALARVSVVDQPAG